MSRLAAALLVLTVLAVAGSVIVFAKGGPLPPPGGGPLPPAEGQVAGKVIEYKAFVTTRIYTGQSGANVYDLPVLTRVLNDIAKQGWRVHHIQRLDNDQFVIVGAKP